MEIIFYCDFMSYDKINASIYSMITNNCNKAEFIPSFATARERQVNHGRKMSQNQGINLKTQSEEVGTARPENSRDSELKEEKKEEPTEVPTEEPTPQLFNVIKAPQVCPQGYRWDASSGKCRKIM